MEPLPAETGRPETGAESTKRMIGRFVLLGPSEHKKGGRIPTINLLYLLHLNVSPSDERSQSWTYLLPSIRMNQSVERSEGSVFTRTLLQDDLGRT